MLVLLVLNKLYALSTGYALVINGYRITSLRLSYTVARHESANHSRVSGPGSTPRVHQCIGRSLHLKPRHHFLHPRLADVGVNLRGGAALVAEQRLAVHQPDSQARSSEHRPPGCFIGHRGLFQPGAQRGDSRRKGVDDDHTLQVLARLEIFRQQLATAAELGGGDDERVPPVEAIAPLHLPSLLDRGGVEDVRAPGKEGADFDLGFVGREGGRQLLLDHRIILVQDLGAEPTAPVAPELFQPLAGALVFDGVAPRVAGIDQQVGISEVQHGHRAFLAGVMARPGCPAVWGAARGIAAGRVRTAGSPPSFP